MEEISADMVVIGSGPAGQKAAIQGAKLGKKVIVIERYDSPGGNCLFSGTIPSKSFREAVIDLTRFHERNFYGDHIEMREITISELMNRLHHVIDEERNMVYRQFKKNNIEMLHGTAKFENPHSLIIYDKEYRMSYKIKAGCYSSLPVPFRDDHLKFLLMRMSFWTRRHCLESRKFRSRWLCWGGCDRS